MSPIYTVDFVLIRFTEKKFSKAILIFRAAFCVGNHCHGALDESFANLFCICIHSIILQKHLEVNPCCENSLFYVNNYLHACRPFCSTRSQILLSATVGLHLTACASIDLFDSVLRRNH